jgi:hypothetical protein
MSNNNNRMIVFASILGAILATGVLALNPSTITSAGAELYGDQYGYDSNHPEKKNVNVQKIKCVNSNINVNGVDITQIPQDSTALAATNDEGTEGANTENGNGLAGINFDRNLVSVCPNINHNEQVRQVGTDGGTTGIECPDDTDTPGHLVTDLADCNIYVECDASTTPLGIALGQDVFVSDVALCQISNVSN